MFSEATTAPNAVNGCWHDSWSTTCKYVPVIRRIRCGILWFDSEFQTLSLLDAFKPICVTGMVYSITNITSHSAGYFAPKLLLLHVPCSPLEFRLKCLLIKPTFLFGLRVATSFLRLLFVSLRPVPKVFIVFHLRFIRLWGIRTEEWTDGRTCLEGKIK